VAAAIGDVAELLDVHVHQFAGPVAFVAADDVAGGAVQVAQPGQAVAGQDAVHGGGHQAEQAGDSGRSPPPLEPDLDDAAFGAGRGAARAGVRAAGAVGHARFAQGAVAGSPPLGGRG
jgi:hypothetical protein